MRYLIDLEGDIKRRKGYGDWRWVGMLWSSLFRKHPQFTVPLSRKSPFWWTSSASVRSVDCSVPSLPVQLFSRLSLSDSSSRETVVYRKSIDAYDDLYRAVYCCVDSDDHSIWEPLEVDLRWLTLVDSTGFTKPKVFQGLSLLSLPEKWEPSLLSYWR